MKKIFTFVLFLSLVMLGLAVSAQNSSPLVVKDFVQKSNEIIDLEQIPKFNRTDLDSNPICRIKVKAVGFEEGILQKFLFVPRGVEITHMVFKDGQWFLHVSSHKNGDITIKYMGDLMFRIPYQLEPGKVYELTLGMETATLVIRTVPTEAEIFVDNQKVGTGEAICSVPLASEHRYRVVCDGYYTKEDMVKFDNVERRELNIELDPNFGFITIKSEPSGADVYIDKKFAGKTPYLVESIARGMHRVEIKKAGYVPYSELVTINVGEHNKELEKVKLEVEEIPASVEVVTQPVVAPVTEPVTTPPAVTPTYTPQNTIKIKDVKFGNCDYDNNIINDYGTTLLTSKMQYLKPKVTYENLNTSVKNVVLDIKIIKPDGSLEYSSSSPDGYTQRMEREVSYGYNNTLYLIGWGNSKGGSYNSGTHYYEIWCEGEKLFSQRFTVYDDIVIKDIVFGNTDYDNNVLDNYGTSLYSSKMRYLRPKITYDLMNRDIEKVELSVKIIKPDGYLMTGTSSPDGYTQKMERNVEYGNNNYLYLIGWGNKNGGTYVTGQYTYEIWYQGKMIKSKSFYIY